MSRLRAWKRIASLIVLLVTISLLALLCRGRTPNRFAQYNLPPWELYLVGKPTLPTDLAERPVSPANIRFIGSSVERSLFRQNEDKLFADLDARPGVVFEPMQAGDPGRWLQQAIVFTGSDPRMRAKIERICARLMDAQNPRGYVGAPNGSTRYPSTYLIGHCENMRGLLAAYSVLHEPALIWAALRAGSFLIDNFDPGLPGDAPARGEVICSLARLYEATGDARLTDFASRAADQRRVVFCPAEGVAMCALFEMTGRKTYLAQALLCRLSDSSPELGAELFKITGNRDFLVPPGKAKIDDAFLDSVAFTRRENELAVNEWRHSVVAIGTTRLMVTPIGTAGSIQMTNPSKQSLRLRIPKPDAKAELSAKAPDKSPAMSVGVGAGGAWDITRRWQKGTVLLAADGETAPAKRRPTSRSRVD